jgi:hypothetical protein
MPTKRSGNLSDFANSLIEMLLVLDAMMASLL